MFTTIWLAHIKIKKKNNDNCPNDGRLNIN